MMKKARWIFPLVAALFLVPCAWATVRVVDLDGTVYAVDVLELSGPGSPEATALSYSVLHPDGNAQTGMVSPTEDSWADGEPSLVLSPGAGGPFLVWSRWDGSHGQIAYSHFEGGAWGPQKYLTSGARDHLHPQVGVDSHGTATLVWVEPAGAGAVMFATFDPATGNLFRAPRDLFRELIRHSPPEWLGSPDAARATHRPSDSVVPTLDGGNDTPAIPPCSASNSDTCKNSSQPSTSIVADPSCGLAAAAVVKNRALWIGVLEEGVVVGYYRSVIPPGAPEGYVAMLLESLLNQHCQR